VVLEEAQRDLAAWLTRWQRNYPNLTNGGWDARRMNADEGGKIRFHLRSSVASTVAVRAADQ